MTITMCPLADPADSFVLVLPAWETDSPPPPPPPCWVLVGKCRTMGAEGALRKICLT